MNVALHFTADLTLDKSMDERHAELLFALMRNKPHRTFSFAYSFNPLPSTPFFPSATFERNGFSVGLQSPNLCLASDDLDAWQRKQEHAWQRVAAAFADNATPSFLGIDTSVASLTDGGGSMVRALFDVARLEGVALDAADPLRTLLSSDLPMRLTAVSQPAWSFVPCL